MALSLAACLAACGGGGALDRDAPHFEGLDGAIVQEVLANPAAVQKIEEEPGETRASMAQGIVTNFIICRDALRGYQEWITTGVQPELSSMPTPANPVDPSWSTTDDYWDRFNAPILAGDPDGLRTQLTGPGSCGSWIPANPGEPDGPTVADVVVGG